MSQTSQNSIKKKISSVIALLMIFISPFLMAQGAVKFNLKVKLLTKDTIYLKNAMIKITEGGKSDITKIVKSKRQAKLKILECLIDLNLNSEYLITCSQKGYVTKSVLIDTHIPKGREQEEFAKFIASVTLEKQAKRKKIKNKKPVGKIKYIEEEQDFNKDSTYQG